MKGSTLKSIQELYIDLKTESGGSKGKAAGRQKRLFPTYQQADILEDTNRTDQSQPEGQRSGHFPSSKL